MWLFYVFLLGFVAGLRTFLAPAIVSWAARLGTISPNSPLAWMGSQLTPLVLSALSLGELVHDKLPMATSRKAPPAFIARIMTGALCGATVGTTRHALALGLLVGAAGAIGGTLGGAAGRAKLATLFGRDLPAALLEDLAGIVIAILSVARLG